MPQLPTKSNNQLLVPKVQEPPRAPYPGGDNLKPIPTIVVTPATDEISLSAIKNLLVEFRNDWQIEIEQGKLLRELIEVTKKLNDTEEEKLNTIIDILKTWPKCKCAGAKPLEDNNKQTTASGGSSAGTGLVD